MIAMLYNTTLIRRRYTVNSIGKVVSTDNLPFLCRVEQTSVRVAGANGETYQTQYVIFCRPDTDISVNDRITDPAGVYPEFVVKSVFVANTHGPHHLEVRV
jgi:hypothetical protein